MTVELTEFVGAFVGESTEHLSAATHHLLAMEEAARRGEPALRHVREVFRALHTVKGLAAMVGVEPIVTIAHQLESILRGMERSSTRPTPALVDALVEGVRAIESRLNAIREQRPVAEPPDALLRRLEGLETQDSPPALPTTSTTDLDPSIAEKLSPAEHEHLARALTSGVQVFRADFAPSPQRAERGLTINTIRERVQKLGELVKVLPRALPASAEAPGGLAFVLLVATREPREALAAAMEIAPEAVVPIAGPPPASVEPIAEPAPEESLESLTRPGVVRVHVKRLDEAIDRLSALVVSRFRLDRAVSVLAERGVDVREMKALLLEHSRQLRDLRSAILQVRMVPIAEVLDRIPIIVRSLRRATGKPVQLTIEGADAELDKSVAERLFPAIVHLVRNAVDHGIETPDERRRRNKPEEGRVVVRCTQHASSRLVLSVSDDGRGVDREGIARRMGVESPSNDAGLLDLLCRPGFSTRHEVSMTSGRGMGMDIVRRIAVDQLGGELVLESSWGVGATFTMIVPLTLSIVDAFTFDCAGQRFVVPVATIEEIVEIDPQTTTAVRDGVSVFFRRGESVPLVPLDRVFRLPRTEGSIARKAFVVRRAGAPLAFAVDRLFGQQEVVVRPLEDPLVQVPGISGATDLGDGRPTLVVDLVALGGGALGGSP